VWFGAGIVFQTGRHLRSYTWTFLIDVPLSIVPMVVDVSVFKSSDMTSVVVPMGLPLISSVLSRAPVPTYLLDAVSPDTGPEVG
jgi:hypothetical protein